MSEEKSLFTRIIEREIPAEIVYEDECCVALNDINPQAPVHLLVVPKKPIRSLAELTEGDAALMGHLMLVVRDLARELELDQGFRIVANTGPDGGQTVDHLHVHLLGRRALEWPPG